MQRVVNAFRGKQLRMNANLIRTAASPQQNAMRWEVAAFAEPDADVLVPAGPWPSPVDDIEEPEIHEVAPGLEDLGLFA